MQTTTAKRATPIEGEVVETGTEIVAEEWRAIEGFPDYAVSSHGRVKRVIAKWKSPAGKILRQSRSHGYRYVFLIVNGKRHACRVHRLVCTAFHGKAPTQDHYAAHNDGTRDNNHYTNLRWATPRENVQDKWHHGTMLVGDRNPSRTKPGNLARGARNGKYTKPERTPRGERHGCARLTASCVLAIRADTRPQRDIAAAYGVSRGAIVAIKSGKTWRHIV